MRPGEVDGGILSIILTWSGSSRDAGGLKAMGASLGLGSCWFPTMARFRGGMDDGRCARGVVVF